MFLCVDLRFDLCVSCVFVRGFVFQLVRGPVFLCVKLCFCVWICVSTCASTCVYVREIVFRVWNGVSTFVRTCVFVREVGFLRADSRFNLCVDVCLCACVFFVCEIAFKFACWPVCFLCVSCVFVRGFVFQVVRRPVLLCVKLRFLSVWNCVSTCARSCVFVRELCICA